MTIHPTAIVDKTAEIDPTAEKAPEFSIHAARATSLSRAARRNAKGHRLASKGRGDVLVAAGLIAQKLTGSHVQPVGLVVAERLGQRVVAKVAQAPVEPGIENVRRADVIADHHFAVTKAADHVGPRLGVVTCYWCGQVEIASDAVFFKQPYQLQQDIGTLAHVHKIVCVDHEGNIAFCLRRSRCVLRLLRYAAIRHGQD